MNMVANLRVSEKAGNSWQLSHLQHFNDYAAWSSLVTLFGANELQSLGHVIHNQWKSHVHSPTPVVAKSIASHGFFIA